MWESFITWYINSYLGNYLDPLETQQLSFVIRQGELELENIPLKKHIFRSWGIPIEIKSSIVGRIKIEFNLMKYFRNEPVLISIEDIYLVAGSINLENWNVYDEENFATEAKMNSLDAHEGRWKAQFDAATNSSSYYSSLYFSSIRIGASIATKLVENLQLNVRNIHIRFEDEIDSQVVGFGITLDSLSVESCDSKWNPLSSSVSSVTDNSSTDCSFKTLQLNNFSVYCDTNTKRFCSIHPLKLKEAMEESCTDHTYLVCPVSAEARITKNNSTLPLVSSLKPRFNVHLTLERVPLQITDSQFRNISRAYKSFSQLRRNCRLRHYRPEGTVKGNAKVWWIYAVRAILTIRGHKQRTKLTTWEDILNRCTDNVAYVKIYQKYLLGEPLSSDFGKIKGRIEMQQHFEEIVILREIAMSRVEKEKQIQATTIAASSTEAANEDIHSQSASTPKGSMFSFMFPSWSKWVSSSSAHSAVVNNDVDNVESLIDTIDASAILEKDSTSTTFDGVFFDEKYDSKEEAIMSLRMSETEFDEAILDDAKAFGCDALLARFNFAMRRSVITLNRKSGPFLELDVGGIDILTELKPRSGSHKFKMTVASLFLRECSTKSILISPHPFSPLMKSRSSSRSKIFQQPESVNREPIFSLLYERKPNKKVGHRIGMTTRPLDLILFPKIWDDLILYFTIYNYKKDDLEILDNRYEVIKQRTKEELRLYWERLISLRASSKEGRLHSNSWEIQLDISAPQIVMHGLLQPDHGKDSWSQRSRSTRCLAEDGGRFLVIDLGKFRFTNRSIENADNVFDENILPSTQDSNIVNVEDEDSEEFLTPCSSPIQESQPCFVDDKSISSPRISVPERKNSVDFNPNDSLGDLQEKLYKKYRLEITDVQVLVVDGRVHSSADSSGASWRTAIAKGVSSIHLVDRFSINLQLERRLIFSDDPQWPALTLEATLPKLNFHLNESKILTMQLILNSFFQPTKADMELNLNSLSTAQTNLNSNRNDLNTSTAEPAFTYKPRTTNRVNAKHFVAQFTIQHITTEIQSSGRSIAELQIIGARTTFTKMTLDTSLTLIIHSLLLADAVQTFGPDFELLLASHKHLSMDSVSGSLRDSDPTSPMSPESPSSPIPFAHQKIGGANQLAIPSQLHDALITSLEGKRVKSSASLRGGYTSPPYEDVALITAKLCFGKRGKDTTDLQVKFNNLDVIANQETLVEILQFMMRVLPATSSANSNIGRTTKSEKFDKTYGTGNHNLLASFEFSRLSLLLLRSIVSKDGTHSARKIATATACDAKINCSLGDENIVVEGSLGGLQMLNLTAEGQYHQRVLSVGKDVLVDTMYDILKMGKTHPTKAELFNETALSFTFIKQTNDCPIYDSTPSFTLRMASVIYTHCPVFLIDLKKCIDQFQAPLATKLKSAAAQIALGLVRQDVHGSGGYNSPVRSLSVSLDNFDVEELSFQNNDSFNIEPISNSILLDVVLDSPVIVLPRSRTSSQVLIANLGQITIFCNTDKIDFEFSKVRSSTPDIKSTSNTLQYNIIIRDISLFSLDLKDKWEMVENLKLTYPTTSYTTLMRAQELYYCDPDISKAILHNTVIHLSIDFAQEVEPILRSAALLANSIETNSGPRLGFQGRVMNSLKLSLTPQQYSQVLDSLDNIAAGEENFSTTEVNVNEKDRKLNWEKELNSFTRKGHIYDLPLPSPTMAPDDVLPISAFFEIPEVIVELVLPEQTSPLSECPHLILSCSELTFDCEKNGYTTNLKVMLKSLILEDLSVPDNSSHRIIAASKTSDATIISGSSTNHTSTFLTDLRSNHFISASCPDLPKAAPISITLPGSRYTSTNSYSSPHVARTETSSLPDRLDLQDIFAGRFFPRGFTNKKSAKVGSKLKNKHSKTKSLGNSCPVTPPPSPRPFEGGDNLVQIHITLVDPKSPQFISKFNATHKFTNINFNTLEVVLSPSTFSHIRRFFNEAATNNDLSTFSTNNTTAPNNRRNSKIDQIQQLTCEEIRNSDMKVTVKALKVKLGHSKKNLAQGDVVGFVCHIINRGNASLAVTGKLGSLELRDESPYAGLYPVKFVFQGEQALDFDYRRRDIDANLRLTMASVLCVHTQRFYNEFSTLVSELFGSTATSVEDPSISSTKPKSTGRNTHLYLNIQAGAPVLLLPYSSTSKSILVADLGHISVQNLENTNSFDCISIDLIEMDLYSSVLTESNPELLRQQAQRCMYPDNTFPNKIWMLNKKLVVVSAVDESSYLKNKCALKLKLIRSLVPPALSTQPVTCINGTLSTVYITLDSDKYKLIRGFLDHNIGENIIILSEMPKVNLVREQRRSFGSDISLATNAAPSQLELSIELELVNVSIELVKDNGEQLCRTLFLKSKFTFQSSSDHTKDIGLVSQEIKITDTRSSGSNQKNFFIDILQPSTSPPGAEQTKVLSADNTEASNTDGTLQAEIRLRQHVGGSNVTVILNNMRLMVVLDWWMEAMAFLSQSIPTPEEVIREESIEYEPIAVSAGIVTKRAPILDIPPTTFELKINVSKCELVVIENPSMWDTNAIILKSTAVFYNRPHLERPIYINLLACELFSCILGLEGDTALSIVDPTKNITLEVVKKSTAEPLGLLDATMSTTSLKILKIQSPQLNLRLSYYDMKMFIQLVNQFSKEAKTQLWSGNGGKMSFDERMSHLPKGAVYTSYDVEKLVVMGFPYEDSEAALEHCEGKLDDAALILSSGQDFATLINPPAESKKRKESNDSMQTTSSGKAGERPDANSISGIEFKCAGLSLCVIDDCKDADVPLLELTVSQLEFSQSFAEKLSRAEGILSGDYYNRQLSGWEPFLEPWKCSLKWKQNEYGQLGKASPNGEFPEKLPRQEITVNSGQVMNINITSTLLNLYETVSINWSEEYQKLDKKRSPFVPFCLMNETGSPLWFTTILSSNDEIFRQQKLGTSHPDGTTWVQVGNGRVQPFSFEGRGKLRHRNTHQLKTHQLVVRVDGWQESNPVSVDRVGTYFRIVKPISTPSTQSSRYGLQNTELPSTRLIFEVSLQGSAQKLVRIRSALLVRNELPDPMELKLENTIIYPGFKKAQTGGSLILVIEPGQVCPVPLHSVCAQMWVRPHRTSELTSPSLYMYCTNPMVLGDHGSDGLRTCCPMISNQIEPYRFCVATKRDAFPVDYDEPSYGTTLPSPTQTLTLGMSKRPNLIVLKSALVIMNLLPHDLHVELKEYGLHCRLGPGKEYSTTNVDISEYIEMIFRFDSFPSGSSLGIQPNSSGFVARLKIVDIQKRPLYLQGKVERRDGGSVRVSLSCPYWIVNKSGIPIICKQEGTSNETAGQFMEHEMGRMVTPLLFNFIDSDKASALTLRVGSNLHGINSKALWCRTFPLQRESVRKLPVTISHSQPEIIYLVGIDVRDGRGRYRDTKIVTITPRFLIDNRSSNPVQISQRNFATTVMDRVAEATHLTLPPACSLPFHWPRLDKDLLLCVRLLNLSGNIWSGGFQIETVDSFHITIRDADENCHFLRVEIVMQGPTYVVVFSDTDKLPAPFRIDNLSLVPITFNQSSVGDARKQVVRAQSSCPYAWDEIMQQPHLTIVAPGGTSAIINMNDLGLVGNLSYENFFYIALSSTFPKEDVANIGGSGMETMELVLEVSVGSKVVLARKESGNRSQLWRVNADGLIEHEGSSPPRDPRKASSHYTMLVLDIAGQTPLPSSYVPLMLRKPDSRRASTQHWEFTRDGRLKCANYSNLFVQAKDGFGSGNQSAEGTWRLWSEIVLGPPQSVVFVRTDSGIPVEQAICRQKLRAGSGRLELRVGTDGPTRVLRITDVERPPKGPLLNHIFEENYSNSIPNFIIRLNLHSGIGASIINCNPREELLYINLSTLRVKWIDTKESETVEASVQNLQIDNQLLEAERPVGIFVTPAASRYDNEEDSQPALLLNWRRLKSRLNAHVFLNWLLTLKPLSIILEETLLLKFCSWIGLTSNSDTLEGLQECQEPDLQIQKAVTNATSLTAKRFYFGFLKIVLSQVRLSVLTASKPTADLLIIKRRLGLTLIRFEEALVELDPFSKEHPFETFEFLLASLVNHYKAELLSQALLVLGSVDFLGNPVGFVNDVSVGVSGLIHEGSVGSLIKNVTHGLSNSAAKVTGSLGDGLGRTFTLDDKHELERRKIIQESNSSSGEQLVAGFRGFGHGVMGGITSIFTQTYEGVTNDGFSGLISGLGKGIVGTVTKPAVGVLDLAAGAASAIRDSSKSSSRRIPPRLRPTRIISSGGLLPTYDESKSRGQELLFEINNRNHSELLIGFDVFKSGVQDLQIIVSNEHVRIRKIGGKSRLIVLDIHLRDLIECQYVAVHESEPSPSASSSNQKKHFLEFFKRLPDTLGVSRPQLLVDNEQTAKKICQQVNYAKILYEEMKHTLIVKPSTSDD